MAFDLDAVSREEAGEPFTFTFGGEEYSLASHLDLRLASAFEAGRLDQALALMLGEEQWRRICDSPATFTEKHLFALFDAYGKHLGVSLGEYKALPGSSNGKAKPSKRTSSATTKRR